MREDDAGARRRVNVRLEQDVGEALDVRKRQFQHTWVRA